MGQTGMDDVNPNENHLRIGLYDTKTDQLIQLPNDGDSISVSSFGLSHVNVAAFVTADGGLAEKVGSMQLLINGSVGMSYFENGEQTVSFEVYSGRQGQGELLATVDRNFTIA